MTKLSFDERFRVLPDGENWIASMFSVDGKLLITSKNPKPTEIEARRQLVMLRTMAVITGRDPGPDKSPGAASMSPVPQTEVRVVRADFENLLLHMDNGEALEISLSIQVGTGKPSLDPTVSNAIMAGPTAEGGFVAARVSPGPVPS